MSVYKKFFCSLIVILGCMVGFFGCGDPLDGISVSVKCESFDTVEEQNILTLIVDSEDEESGKAEVTASIAGLKGGMLSTIEWNYDKRFLFIEKSQGGHSATISGINPTLTPTVVTAYSVENYKAKYEFLVNVVIKAKDAAPMVEEGKFGIPVATDFAISTLEVLEFTPSNASIPQYSYKIFELNNDGEREGLLSTVDENQTFSLESIPESGKVEIECIPYSMYLNDLEKAYLTVVIPNVVVYTSLNEENTFIQTGAGADVETITSISLVRNDMEKYRAEIDIVNSLDLPLSVSWRGEEELDDWVLVERLGEARFSLQAIDVSETTIYFDVKLGNIENSILYTIPLFVSVSTLPSYISVNDNVSDDVYVANVSNLRPYEFVFDIVPNNAVVDKVIKIKSLTNFEIGEYRSKLADHLVGYLPSTLSLKAVQFNGEDTQDVLLNGFRKGTVHIDTEGEPTEFELQPNEEGKCVLKLKNIEGSCGKVIFKVTVNDISNVVRLVVVNLLQYANVMTDVKMGETSAMTLDVNGEDQLLNLVNTAGSNECSSAVVRFQMSILGGEENLPYDRGITEGNLVNLVLNQNNNDIVLVSAVEKDGDYGKFTISAGANSGNTYIDLVPYSGNTTRIYVNVYSEASVVNAFLNPKSVTDNSVGFGDGYVNITQASNMDIKNRKVLLKSDSSFNLRVVMDKSFNYDDEVSIKCEHKDGDVDGFVPDNGYYLSVTQDNVSNKGNFTLHTLNNSNKNDKVTLKVIIDVFTRKVTKDISTGAYVLPSSDANKMKVGSTFEFEIEIFHPVRDIVFRQKNGQRLDNLVYIDILTTQNTESDTETLAEEDEEDLGSLIISNMKKSFYVGLQGGENKIPSINPLEDNAEQFQFRLQNSDATNSHENNYCKVESGSTTIDLEHLEIGDNVDINRERYLTFSISSKKIEKSIANFVSAEFFVEFSVIDYNRVVISNEIRVVVTLLGANYKINLTDYKEAGKSITEAEVSSGVRLEPYRAKGFSFNASVSVPNKNYVEDMRLWIVETDPQEGESYIKGLTTYMYMDYSFDENSFVDLDEDKYNKQIITIDSQAGTSKGEVHFDVNGKLDKSGYVYIFFLPKSLINLEAELDPSEIEYSLDELVINSLVAQFMLACKTILFHVPKGSKTDPYFISYEQDLVALNDNDDAKGKNYVLTRDIEITGDWRPITDFSGSLSSGEYLSGYNITGINWDITINGSSPSSYGIFDTLSSGARISNINIEVENYSITVTNGSGMYSYGILAGKVVTKLKGETGASENPSGSEENSENPSGSEENSESISGSDITIENVLINCKKFSFSTTASSNFTFYLGGIGEILGNDLVKVSNYCVNMDMVTINSQKPIYFGALAGDNKAEWITNENAKNTVSAYVNASLSGECYVGGAVGLNDANKTDDSNSYYGQLLNIETNGKITVNSPVATDITAFKPYVGGLVGQNKGALIDSQSFMEIETTGTACVGGAVGVNGGNIQNVGVEVATYLAGQTAIKAHSGNIGGLVGEMYAGSINLSYVFDNQVSEPSIIVSGDNSNIGGLVGKITGIDGGNAGISESYIVGSIKVDNSATTNCVGGICGYSEYVIIADNYAHISIGAINAKVGAMIGTSGGNTTINTSYAVIPNIYTDAPESTAIVSEGEATQATQVTLGNVVLWYNNGNDSIIFGQTSGSSGLYDQFSDDIWDKISNESKPILKNNSRIVLTGIELEIEEALPAGVSYTVLPKEDPLQNEKVVVINYNVYPKPRPSDEGNATNEIALSDLFVLDFMPTEAKNSPIIITSSNPEIFSITNQNNFSVTKLVINNQGVAILRITSKMDSNIFAEKQISITNAFDSIDVQIVPSKNSIVKQNNTPEEPTEGINSLFAVEDDIPTVKLMVNETGSIGVTYCKGGSTLSLQNVSGGVYILAKDLVIGGELSDKTNSDFALGETLTGYIVYDLENLDKCSVMGTRVGNYTIYIIPYIKYNCYDDSLVVTQKIDLIEQYKKLAVEIVVGAYDIDFDVNTTDIQVSDNFVGALTFVSNGDHSATVLGGYCTYSIAVDGKVSTSSDVTVTFGAVTFDADSRARVDFTIEFSDEFRNGLTMGTWIDLVVSSIATTSEACLRFCIHPQSELHVDLKFYSDMLDNDYVMQDAGYLSSTTILPGHFGLLNIDVSPVFLDYDYVTITSPAIESRVISVWQRVRQLNGLVMNYLVLDDVEILPNGLILSKASERVGSENIYDGNYYLRLLTAGGLPVGYSVELTIDVIKDNHSILTQNLTLTVRDAGVLKLTYNPDRYNQDEDYYYVAIGTGGVDQSIQNQNEIGVEIDESIYTTYSVTGYKNGTEIKSIVRRDGNRYYLDLSDYSTSGIELDDELKVILQGIVGQNNQSRRDSYTIKFKVVDIYIDSLAVGLVDNRERNVDNDSFRLLYSNNKSYKFRIFNSVYNTVDEVMTPIILSNVTFGSESTNNLKTWIENLNDNLANVSIIPEAYADYFTFDGHQIVLNDLSPASYNLNVVTWYKYNNGMLDLKLDINDSESGGYKKLMISLPLSFYQLLSKDSPNPIYKWEELRGMQENIDYIVMNDIEIPTNADWLPIKTAISSLDGNNYSIILPNTIKSGLFDEIGSNTVLKNITIRFKESTLNLANDVSTFGALAKVNRGVIYNCLVDGRLVTLTDEELPQELVIHQKTSITMTSSSASLGGLVVQNGGYITNSRVQNIDLRIMGSGSVGGLVVQNSGYISASFYKGGELRTGSGASELRYIAGGLAATNTGHIWGSFAGSLVNSVYDTNIIATTSAGFVVTNSGSIVDCYSAVNLTQSFVGGSSGFVHTNSGAISRVYTVSKIRSPSNNIIGSCEPLVNVGNSSVEYAYYLDTGYYVPETRVGDEISNSNFSQKGTFETFIFSNVSEFDGTWVLAGGSGYNYFDSSNFGPMLVSASRIDNAQKELVSAEIDTASGNALYTYQYTGNSLDFRPMLVTNMQELNDVFANPVSYQINAVTNEKMVCDDVRLARNISFSDLSANIRYAGSGAFYGSEISTKVFEGNGYTISNIDLVGQYKGETLGLIGSTKGAVIQNLDVTVNKVWGSQTKFVGVLVGHSKNNTILHNIHISGNSYQSSVSGLNIVGSVVGYAEGNTLLEYITSSVPVTANFVDDRVLNTGNVYKLYGYDFIDVAAGEGMAVALDKLGYAGGIVGVMDTTTQSNNLSYTLSGTILGKVVGGIAGFVGSKAQLTDSIVTVGSGHISAVVFGGGLVGENHGVISYCVVDYIDATTNVFENALEEARDCIAIGGLVGLNLGLSEGYYQYVHATPGTIYLSGAYIDVSSSNAKYIGGLVGLTIGGDIYEVFATGNVYGSNSSTVGGLIGAIGDISKISYVDSTPSAESNNSTFIVLDGAEATNAPTLIIHHTLAYNTATGGQVGGFAGYYSGGIVEAYSNTNVYNNSYSNEFGEPASSSSYYSTSADIRSDIRSILSTWDGSAITTIVKNGKTVPQLQKGVADATFDLKNVDDVWQMLWHPDKEFNLKADIVLSGTGIVIGDEKHKIVFTGKIIDVEPTNEPRHKITFDTPYFIYNTSGATITDILFVAPNEGAFININDGVILDYNQSSTTIGFDRTINYLILVNNETPENNNIDIRGSGLDFYENGSDLVKP